MKRQLSGDRIHILSFSTLKSGSPLVAQQGYVMRAIYAMEPSYIPKIYWIGKDWYVMQTIRQSLGPESYRTWDWKEAARSMSRYWYMPENWFYQNSLAFDAMHLFNYIEEHWGVGNLDMPSIHYLKFLYENSPAKLTHGDLTHENTVIEYTKTYKFIDWQAQRHSYIPPHKDVDYGKMLQSLIGWDKDSMKLRTLESAREIRALLDECPMASFWCAIHFMRIKARAKEYWQKDLCDENIDYCSWLYAGKKEVVA
jgi:hypothetical protein